MSPNKTTRKRQKARKPVRLKEARAGYAVRPHRPKPSAQDIQLEFSIRLPAGSDAEAFTDKLIELVEAFKGTVGGGTVAVGK